MSTETRRLLVGLDHPGEMDEPRRYLVDLVSSLGGLGVDVRVAMFGDGPVRGALEEVSEVVVVPPLRRRSPAGIAQSLARRVTPSLADAVHRARTASVRRLVGEPDSVLIHGPRAARLLGYVPDRSVPVATYAHPWDFSIAGLALQDRRRLVGRTSRFLVADPSAPRPGSDRASVTADLVAAGVDIGRIETAPEPTAFPEPPRTVPARRSARAALGVDDHELVVAIPAVTDWCESPDLTLPMVWEMERRTSGPRATFVWYGMPERGEPRWAVDYDVELMGLTTLRLETSSPTWNTVVDAADVLVVPLRTTGELPEDFAFAAARRGVPVVCWAAHPRSDEVAAAGGTVIESGDVEAMADAVTRLVEDPDRESRLWRKAWSAELAGLERLTSLTLVPRDLLS